MRGFAPIHRRQVTGRLANKVALVIGAARGIGEGIAQRFVEEGAKVVIADTEAAAGQETAARLNGLFVGTDISRSEHAERAVQTAIKGFGGHDHRGRWRADTSRGG